MARAAAALAVLATAATSALAALATAPPAQAAIDPAAADPAPGYPKTAAYLPIRYQPGDGARLARYDLAITRGVTGEDAYAADAYARNPRIVNLIVPYISQKPTTYAGTGFSAIDGGYSMITAPLTDDPVVGTVRAFSGNDLLKNLDGTIHRYGDGAYCSAGSDAQGTVTLLARHLGDTAVWSARARAYFARKGGLGTKPYIFGIFGDNDLWSNADYAFGSQPAAGCTAAQVQSAVYYASPGSATAKAAWDDGVVRHYDELRRILPGKLYGGNGSEAVAADPSLYKGTIAGGQMRGGNVSIIEAFTGRIKAWGTQSAADRTDGFIRQSSRFLDLKLQDGKQRYLILNPGNIQTASADLGPAEGRLTLAVATVIGAHYWPYRGPLGTFTNTFDYTAPELGSHFDPTSPYGGRGWLGQPTGAAVRVAAGVWKRAFQYGSVILNSSTATVTVDGRSVPPGDAVFVRGGSAPAPEPAPSPSPTPTTGAPVNTALPVVSGTFQQGQTLTATTGSWTNSPTGYTITWQRCGATGTCGNTGGTGTRYTLTDRDVYHRIRVVVQAANATGSATAASTPSAIVGW